MVAGFLARVGGFSARHRWWVLACWCVVIAGLVVAAVAFSRPFTDEFRIRDLPSLQTLSDVEEQFGGSSSGQVVFSAPEGARLTDAAAATVRTLSADLAAVPGVVNAPDPFTEDTGMLSPDGRIGSLPVTVSGDVTAATEQGIERAVERARGEDLQVEVSSGLVPVDEDGHGELIGIVLALIVLLVTFGSLVAAGMPLVTAVLGLVAGTAAIEVATAFTTLHTTATVLATLLGLAVGIDYSLFVVARHRRHLQEGMRVQESIARANGTAGTAVFFAAMTVVVALSGLAVVKIDFLTAMGLCGAAAVLIAMLMALTLTPALLALAGGRVLSRRQRRAPRSTRAGGEAARRWAELTGRHPVLFVVASVVLLGVVAAPVVSLRVGLPTDGSYPESSSARRAYDLMAEGFGDGINGPVVVVASYPSGEPDDASVAAVGARLAEVDDVAAVSPAQVQGRTAVFTVLPEGGPTSSTTRDLVHRLRADGTADGLRSSPTVLVTGQTAVDIDISDRVAEALPLYLGLVSAFSFVLLLLVFRSLVIPLKAIVSFALSLGASLGAVVAVFQWGWFAGPVGAVPGPLLSFLPVIVTGVLFGLSMDYEMFLVSGIHERRVHGEAPRAAVTGGFGTGARVVVAAALIMVGVFAGGAQPGDPTAQPIAFALAVGVLLDAFVVRLTLVPAVLAMCGSGAWWLPRRLDRILPHVDLEGAGLRPASPAGAVDADGPRPGVTTAPR